MGQSAVRVHQMPEGLHEQQGRPEGHVRTQRGSDLAGPIHHPQPPPRHARSRQTDGRSLPRSSRRSREDLGGHHHCRRDPGDGSVLPDRARPAHQEQRAAEDELHGPDQRHHLVGRRARLQDASQERVHAGRAHRYH